MIKWFKSFGLLAIVAAVVAPVAASATGGTTVKVAKSEARFHPRRQSRDDALRLPAGQDGNEHVLRRVRGAVAAAADEGETHAGPGVKAALLGTTKRKDGKVEVTYNGHPLYHFVTDRKPGQTTGEGVNQFGAPWWVLSTAGKEIHNG